MRVKLVVALSVLGIAALVSLKAGTGIPRRDPHDEWATCTSRIAHAMGGHEGLDYPNSRAAFRYNYERGFRVFEIDLSWTRDGRIVLAHDWASPSRYPGLTLPPTERAFRGALVYGIWPTLTLDSLVEIASEYRDAHFILDYRGRAEDFIIPVVERFLARAPEALDRLIPQIMLQTQLRPVLKAYPFSSIIYTLYASPDSDDEVIRFVEAHDIGVVVMNSERADSAFVSALSLNGVSVFVHTVNDASAAARFERMGARGVMTDFLPPDSLCD